MTLDPSIVNPIEFPRWNESLRSLPGCSFFHTSSWAEVLHRSYGYQPFYFTIGEGEALSALLPCMGISSALTGKRGVCLPFTDYCEPLVSGAAQFQAMFAAAVAFGKSQSWKYLEFRGGETFFKGRTAFRMALRPYPRSDGGAPEDTSPACGIPTAGTSGRPKKSISTSASPPRRMP